MMRISPQQTRLVAFYLPQFHAIPENDEWWGKGFTEWTNVRKAEPRFPRHYQPHVPGQLGYYDLRDPRVRIAQAELARDYGVYGFCYYHYWFNGKRLLETPFNEVLRTKMPDFPFCLCWANENWTRQWDGASQDVLMAQQYSEDDSLNFINDLIPALRDDRYIRVNGKPLLLVYRTGLLPDPSRTSEIWREAVQEAGIGDIYLARVENSLNGEEPIPEEIGFDAAVEFAPYWKSAGERINPEDGTLSGVPHSEAGLRVYDYEYCIADMLQRELPAYKLFRGVFPTWDNTPRRKAEGTVFVDSSPEKYRFWLSRVIRQTVDRYDGDERLVFVNAWNEWGEGCHLEPDVMYGMNYLEATRDAVMLAQGDIDLSNMTDHDIEMAQRVLLSVQRIEKAYNGAIYKSHSKTREIMKCQQNISELQQNIACLQRNISDILNTKSWKITAPLRRILESINNINS
jgi:lipopolysaccharide biosynthesis protein